MMREEILKRECEREYILQQKERHRIRHAQVQAIRKKERQEKAVLALLDMAAGVVIVIFIMAGSWLDHHSWIPALGLLFSMFYLVVYGIWRGVFL